MMPHILSIFLILPLATFEFAIGKEARIQDSGENRRILHQSLFPDSSPPPPPPPLLPSVPATPDQDQPFYHETGPTPDQVQQSPPAPAYGTPVANPTVNQQQQQQQAATKPIKKVAIAISVGTVILGMLSALAFYLYKHRVRQTDESQKLVGSNSQRTNDPPSTFLNIGAVEPSTTGTVSTDTNSSPYRKLNSGKRSDRYRPSPDLQPLPPLTKPPLPPNINSPPPMSSSDDESHETNFYTPQELSMINESPRSRQFYSGNNTGQMNQARPDSSVSSPLPHSKRSSPKSRLSASSPDKKYPVIPPIKQSLPSPSPPTATSPLGPLQASRPAPPNIPNRAKIPAPPPPPPNMAHLQSTKEEEQQASKFPMRPPPPPPPPPPSFPIPRKLGAVGTNKPPVPKKSVRPQSKSPSPKSSPGAERRSPVKEVTKALSTPRKLDDDDDDEKDDSKPKLKLLHWDKVRATSDRATVWDSLKSSSFQLNEDAMESLFGCKSTNSATKESTRKSVLPPLEREIRVLDPKKSQNIAIMLRALNVTRDEVAEALLDGSSEGLGLELLETLVKMAPTKEEEIKLKDYSGDSSKLGTAERFLKAILDIPFAFRRVEAMLYRENFSTEVKYLRKSFQTLEEASEELKSSHLFIKLLEAVLRTGNRMNVGTNRGGARAFKLDTLLKLVDIKGTDGKTTLLHFVVQEIIRSEGAGSDPITDCHPHKTNFRSEDEDFKKQGLQVVAGLSKELGNVKKAAGMDSDVLSSYVSKLEMGLEKVRLILQHEKQSIQGKFFNSMKMFLKEAEDEIIRIKAEERKALSMVKEVTEYFHGDAAKVEAHPLRIFMIVRDFLSILDNVCKDVGRMQEKTTVGAGRSFRVPANASLPVLSRYNMWHDRSSDDDSM